MKTILTIFILASANILFAGDFISPFQIGNKFYYRTSGGYFQREMLSDTVIDGKTYLVVKSSYSSGIIETTYERLDIATLVWYRRYLFPCPEEFPIIGFNYNPGQTWYQCMPSNVSDSLSFSGDTSNVLGDPAVIKMVKKVPTWRASIRHVWTYCEKFGYVSHFNPSTNYREWLVGAVVNGVTYGVTGIQTISNVIPEKFTLEQNYPNPFNPSTLIKFAIPVNGPVKLKVYDILGREVAKLVNTNLLAGTYEYSFDGSKLSSGVYFYSLEAGDFKETKRMLLVK